MLRVIVISIMLFVLHDHEFLQSIGAMDNWTSLMKTIVIVYVNLLP